MMMMTRHAAKTTGPTTGARSDASMKLRGVDPASVPLAPDVADAEVRSAGFISISHHAAHPCAFTSLPTVRGALCCVRSRFNWTNGDTLVWRLWWLSSSVEITGRRYEATRVRKHT